MIPGWAETLAASGVAAAFFSLIGLPLARLLAGPGLAPLGIAPALGWAVFSSLALPWLGLTGFGPMPAGLLCAACLAGAAYGLQRTQAHIVGLPYWAMLLAGCVALLPMSAILPKHAEGGILLGPPMFDHVKVAIVDAVLRQGLPVRNPFIGGDGPAPLAYYYLWHFSAAVLGACLPIGGWAADAAMTGFTAWASLLLMMSLAVAASGRALAGAAVCLLALPASVRPVLDALAGHDASGRLLSRNADIGGWLNQAAWVPQHLASACCAVLAVLLMPGLADKRAPLAALVLGIVVAAGFESSTWVGGAAFAAAGPLAGAVLLLSLPQGARLRFAGWAAGAALVAAALVAPFVLTQLAAVAQRHGGPPVALLPYPTFGRAIPGGWRTMLNLPAFWLVALPFALPAVAPLALASRFMPRALVAWPHARPLTALALACLTVAWLFRSTIDNNDLGWRAVLPAILVLTAFAAASLAHLAMRRRWGAIAGSLVLAALGATQAAYLIGGYVAGQHPGAATDLAQSSAAWNALRRVSAPSDRVANNPKSAALATPWPVNIAWALLSDRPSCYSQWETVLAYGALTRPQLDEMTARVQRVFDGQAALGDTAVLAWRYECRLVLLTPEDGAWRADPFAASPDYSLAGQAGRWRIYRRHSARSPG